MAVFDVGADRQWIVAVAQEGNLYRRESPSPATGGPWQDLGRPAIGVPASQAFGVAWVTYVTGGATVRAVYVVGEDGLVYELLLQPGGAYAWAPAGALDCSGGCTGPVQAAVHTVGFVTYVRVFASRSGSLWEVRRDVSGAIWTTPVGYPIAGATLDGDAPVGSAVTSDGRLHMFARGTTATLQHVFRLVFTGLVPDAPWQDLGQPVGAGCAAPSVCVDAPIVRGTADGASWGVLVRGTDGHLWGRCAGCGAGGADWVDRGRPRDAPTPVNVSKALNSADTVAGGVFGATWVAGDDGQLYMGVAGGPWTALGKPRDTLDGVQAAVTVLHESDGGVGPLVWSAAALYLSGQQAVRYLYELRMRSVVWRNHGTFWPGVFPTQRAAISATVHAPNTEPDLDEYYGRLLAVARWRTTLTDAQGNCCNQKLITTAHSFDDGVTWADGPTLPPTETGGGNDWVECTPTRFRDGAVAFGPDGRAYAIMQTNTSGEPEVCGCSETCPMRCQTAVHVIMFYSDDFGLTWQHCQTFPGSIFQSGPPPDGSGSIDKTNVAVDWSTGRVLASVSRYDVSPDQVMLKYSDDRCSTWQPATPLVAATGWPSGLQVGDGGTVVVDAPEDEDAIIDDPFRVWASFDGGLTFSALPSAVPPLLMSGNDLTLRCAGCNEGASCGLGVETPPVPVLYASSWPGVAVSWFRIGDVASYRFPLVSAMARDGYDLVFRYLMRQCTPACVSLPERSIGHSRSRSSFGATGTRSWRAVSWRPTSTTTLSDLDRTNERRAS